MNKWIVLMLAIMLMNCSNSPMVTSRDAEKNKIDMMQLKIGMSQKDVREIMGNPYKTKEEVIGGESYQVWFYLTKGTMLGQTELVDENFTPIVFKDEIVIGWGYHYYDYLRDVNNIRAKYADEKRQKYTDDKEEWPSNQHKILLPPGIEEEKKERDEKPIEKDIKEIEEIEKQEKAPEKKEIVPEIKPKKENIKEKKSDKESHYYWWD